MRYLSKFIARITNKISLKFQKCFDIKPTSLLKSNKDSNASKSMHYCQLLVINYVNVDLILSSDVQIYLLKVELDDIYFKHLLYSF